MKKFLRISELEELTNISNSTVRRYLRDYDSFFVEKGDRVKTYDSQAVDILKRIKQLTDEGMGKEGIHNVLMNEFPIVVKDENEEKEVQHSTGLATVEDVAEIKNKLENLENFNKSLLEKLDQQQKYIDDRLNKQDQRNIERDQKLMKAIDERLEAQKQIAVAQEEPQEKKGFFARLFGK